MRWCSTNHKESNEIESKKIISDSRLHRRAAICSGDLCTPSVKDENLNPRLLISFEDVKRLSTLQNVSTRWVGSIECLASLLRAAVLHDFTTVGRFGTTEI